MTSVRSRVFRDDADLEWEVREITNAMMPPSLAKLLGDDRRRSGWLAFTSVAGDRRRLSPYPPDWATVSDFEIARWCAKAQRVPPAPGRRQQD
jgi:hypothetical protein